MSTRRIGFGIVVSSDDAAREQAAMDAHRKRAAPKRFFAVHEMPSPSPLFDTMADTFYFAKDIEGRFVWSNRLLQEKHGLPRDDIIGKCDHDFLRRDIADRIRADDLAVMSGEAVIDNKLEVIGDAKGALNWLCTTKKPLRNKRGELVGIEGISRDMLRMQDLVAPYHAFKNAIEYLQQHFTRGISIDQLAHLSQMSLSMFERKFKQHFSVTPRQYILHMRVQEACRRLPVQLNIADVAIETGFGGQDEFTRQFSSVVGITPRQYQRMMSAGSDVDHEQ